MTPFKEKKLDIPTGGTICLCSHCGERFGSSNGKCAILCKNCRKAEQRKAMDEENKKIFESLGLTFKCGYCD